MEFRDLRGLIDSSVAYEIAGQEPGVHLGVPSPTVTLVVDLRDGLDVAGPGLDGVQRFRVCLGGMHHVPYRIHHDGSQRGVQLGLTPDGVRALFGLPVAELSHTCVEAADVAGALGAELHERLAEASVGERGRVAVEVLAAHLVPDGHARRPRLTDASCRAQPDAAAAWAMILRTGGRVTVRELTERSGWSARYLTAKFNAEYGMGLKQAARLVRFDRALADLRRGMAVAAAAQAHGYADQSHLSREFRGFLSVPPGEYLARRELAEL
ncbi:helix-turn-helix domain-containing protein [Tsukamurella sp. 8F]|uniref:helix-turn-helix domain-containing protein n=1 Tax=unclassified Tsukamurella TaxID=2633480 RepID=UPI0023B8C3E3|nr:MULTISPECIES: helix-turn-helix domain-containing protein [unclassified Tsukamurella]MDF0531567.1 helix-turn-helix domain-containing protein [Tsukamurella sp. 8J]MDF0587586.1 helix-turn-helix domain-containing protein [Tsukamurella sp. 8F]